MKINVLYRISDKGRPKEKLAQATPQTCLKNAIAEFGVENITLFADNCDESTIEMIRSLGIEPILTSLGNSGSLRHIISYAIDNLNEEEIVYLLEDDYLHKEGSAKCIVEGLGIADYVTLYDNPDKYWKKSEGGNRYVKNGGERTRVLVTESTHWKITNSTTMTYACKVGTLKQDFPVWKKHSSKKTPKSFYAYRQLRTRLFGRRRILISSIPARSTHAEVAFLSPIVDWSEFRV